MVILITRPNYDEVTNYLHYWTQPVIDLLKKKSKSFVDLTSSKANRTLFQQYLQKLKPNFLFLNGHGSPTMIAGQNHETLLSSQENLTIYKNAMFYCRSCDSATNLGNALVQAGAKAFIGYKRRFTFGYVSSYLSRPLLDPLAKLFLEPSNLIPVSLIKGNKAAESYQRSQAAMRTNLRKMLSSNSTFEERYYSAFLWSNIKSQVLLGDTEAKI